MSRRTERIQDEILILEYRAGDLSALQTLISRWQRRIYYYVLTLVQDRTMAWDLSQEVWLAVIAGLGKLRCVKNFSPWIYRIARNKAASHIRNKRRAELPEETYSETAEEHTEPPPDRMCAAEDARLVHECLLELPLAQREALSLFYLDDLSLDEIARLLEVPRGTVQSRLHYGRIKMGQLLLKKGYSHEQG